MWHDDYLRYSIVRCPDNREECSRDVSTALQLLEAHRMCREDLRGLWRAVRAAQVEVQVLLGVMQAEMLSAGLRRPGPQEWVVRFALLAASKNRC